MHKDANKTMRTAIINTVEREQTDVLIYDSGVGGLSICNEIITTNKALRLNYLSDNAAFPYGEKSESFLIDRANKVILQAAKHIDFKILVVACNTASTIVLPALRQQLSVPVVGVVPAIKTAAAMSKTETFGLLATPGTVNRDYTQQLINQYAADKQVISVGSSKLVQLIESYLCTGEIDILEIEDILSEFNQKDLKSNIDTMVMGCTHFPLIRSILESLRPQWQWLDSGPAIASRIYSLLEEKGSIQKTNSSKKQHQIWFTSPPRNNPHFNQYLLSKGFDSIRPLLV